MVVGNEFQVCSAGRRRRNRFVLKISKTQNGHETRYDVGDVGRLTLVGIRKHNAPRTHVEAEVFPGRVSSRCSCLSPR